MRKRYKIGFTAGVFDLLHKGHLNILKRAGVLSRHPFQRQV